MNLMSRVNLWLPVFLFTGSGFSLGAAFVSFTKGNTGSTVFSLVMAVVDMAIGAVMYMYMLDQLLLDHSLFPSF